MPVTDDPEAVTLGEVNRTMLRLVDKVEDMSKSYPTWHDVNRIVDNSAKRSTRQDERIKSLEGVNRWVARAIGTALIGAVITALLLVT